MFDFKFVISDSSCFEESFQVNVPLITDRIQMLQLFSDEIKKYESLDFDLYFVKKYTYNDSKNLLYYKIDYDEKFVVDFNQTNHCGRQSVHI